MKETHVISALEARRFMLTHLLLTEQKKASSEAVLEVFERIKSLQFDPLSVAGQNHNIALNSRLTNYQREITDALLYSDRALLDAWDRKMGIIRTLDWPSFHHFHEQTKQRLGSADGQIFPVLDAIRAHITEHGATAASDLGIKGEAAWWFGVGNWGSPALGRVALEAMLMWGELVIANKHMGRKSYDFASRLLPKEIVEMPDPFDTDEAYARWRVLRCVTASGLIRKGNSPAWVMTQILSPEMRKATIEALLDDGELMQISIAGSRQTLLACTKDFEAYAQSGFVSDGRLRFIAPLDNLMWDKSLISFLFDFDYHWEVYDPPAKRKYGYYVLPILLGDEFIGRIEPTFKKDDEVMLVKGLWWDKGHKPRQVTQRMLKEAIGEYARFLGSDGYRLVQ
ncbi:MAG: winged helix DNA-binding domain-containing protein [Coriobacteriia bacterium]|nr:winged helix DNA-binding domain-containing protein [Coriobacteriia bacterium]